MIDSLFLLAAIVFGLTAVWVNDHKQLATESGNDAGLRCLHDRRSEVSRLIVSIVVGGFILSEISWRWYGTDWLRGVTIIFVNSWLFCAAWSDFKSRRVSNRWILYGIGVGLCFLAAKLIFGKEGWLLLADRCLGAFLSSSILFAGGQIRRGGIGMGDVKVFFVLGLFFGLEQVFTLLLITLVAALIVGTVQIVCRKIGRKDRFPLCPYAYASLVFAVLGGL